VSPLGAPISHTLRFGVVSRALISAARFSSTCSTEE
jgi:hypothetical protein